MKKTVIEMARRQHRPARNQLRERRRCAEMQRFLSTQLPALPLRDCDQRGRLPLQVQTLSKTAVPGLRRTDDVHRDLRSEFLEQQSPVDARPPGGR